MELVVMESNFKKLLGEIIQGTRWYQNNLCYKYIFPYRGERYKVQGGGVYKVQGEGVYKVQGTEDFSEKGRL